MYWGRTQALGIVIGAVVGVCIGGYLYFGSFGLRHEADPASIAFAGSAIPAAAIGGWLCAVGALLGVRLAGIQRQRIGAALGAGTVAVLGSVTFFAIYGAGDGTPKYMLSAGAVSLALVAIAAVIAAMTVRRAPSGPRSDRT